jgi:hypothetical protein
LLTDISKKIRRKTKCSIKKNPLCTLKKILLVVDASAVAIVPVVLLFFFIFAAAVLGGGDSRRCGRGIEPLSTYQQCATS